MNSFKRFSEWLAKVSCHDLLRAKNEVEHLRRITAALAYDISVSEMAKIVVDECSIALNADAACLFLMQEDSSCKMVAERNCTSEFKAQWEYMPPDALLRLCREFLEGKLFVGSPQDFKKIFPSSSDLVDASGRKVIAYVPLGVNGKMIGALGFSYDREIKYQIDPSYVLTMINFCAQALERVRLMAREQLARRQAESANRAKTAFLANVSHEIRTPIGVIQGFTALLLQSKGLSEQQRHWAQTICRNTSQLNQLVGEVLDLSKIEADNLEAETTEFSLLELLTDVMRTAEFKAKEKGLRFFLESTIGFDWIRSDPTRIRQVLFNLVGNAIKFTDHGYVKLRIESSNQNQLDCRVIDTGIGIEDGFKNAIFEPFVQADASNRRRFGGTGLGLTIARRLAHSLGGTVALETSAVGKGSIFKFSTPYETAPEHFLTPPAIRQNSSVEPQLDGLSILLVEDCIDNQELIRYMLNLEGASVDIADGGAEGVAKALSNDYHVVLMDIQMPGLDGHEAVAQLRAKGYRRPIAALTAHALSTEKQKALREGFDDYLTKPIDRLRLIHSLKGLSIQAASTMAP